MLVYTIDKMTSRLARNPYARTNVYTDVPTLALDCAIMLAGSDRWMSLPRETRDKAVRMLEKGFQEWNHDSREQYVVLPNPDGQTTAILVTRHHGV